MRVLILSLNRQIKILKRIKFLLWNMVYIILLKKKMEKRKRSVLMLRIGHFLIKE
jgi:hypothetical protein